MLIDSGIKHTQSDYTLAFKLAMVEQVEKASESYKQALAHGSTDICA